jgi:hypothetical protein
MGLRYFLDELGYRQLEPSEIYMDNQSFLDTITKGKGCSERSKEAWEQDEIDLKHLRFANMAADLPTKHFAREQWYRLRAVLLGNAPIALNS